MRTFQIETQKANGRGKREIPEKKLTSSKIIWLLLLFSVGPTSDQWHSYTNLDITSVKLTT